MTDKADGWGDRVDGFVKTIKEICLHYAEKLGYDPVSVFEALEKKRTYSYPNYYQYANFPKLDDVKVFKTRKHLMDAVQSEKGFRCPSCSGVSKNPYECDTGLKMSDSKTCDWKAYGFLGTLGKGVRLIIAENWIDNPIVDIFLRVEELELLANDSR